MKAITDKIRLKQRQESVSKRFMKLISISEDNYHMLHYDLAFAWFRYHEYFEVSARQFVFSKSYHQWWSYILMMLEEVMLNDYENSDLGSRKLKELYIDKVLDLNYRPNTTLALKCRQECEEAMHRNPDLKKMKIYR